VDEFVQGEMNRQILIMFYVEDMTQEEIEEKLHTSVSTVKRVCKRFGIPIFRMMEKREL
jgi:DNA-directed RNA polymerase specialized sigma subunit